MSIVTRLNKALRCSLHADSPAQLSSAQIVPLVAVLSPRPQLLTLFAAQHRCQVSA